MPLIRATVVADVLDYPPILEALVRISERQRRANLVPSLHDAAKAGKAVWVQERGDATLRSALQTYRDGWGDCKHYSVWLAADLRARGEDARVVLKPVRVGLYHAVVLAGDGTVRDPSKVLGMRTGRKAR